MTPAGSEPHNAGPTDGADNIDNDAPGEVKPSASTSSLAGRKAVSFRSPSPGTTMAQRRGHNKSLSADEMESSGDEHTAILSRSRDGTRDYQTNQSSGTATAAESRQASRARKDNGQAQQRDPSLRSYQTTTDGQRNEEDDEELPWYKQLAEKYGSVELENKGSVARDHLALERTFLAWLRTALSFASIGIAVTQLFRLNSTIASNDPSSTGHHLRQVGKPLGATFLAIAIVILFVGYHRFFEGQHYIIKGKFPASRGSIIFVAFVAGSLIVASLAVILAVAPGVYEN